MQVEVGDSQPNDGGIDPFGAAQVGQRSRQPRCGSAQGRALIVREITKPWHVPARNDQQVTEVGSWILFQWYRVERNDKRIVHEEAPGNRKVAANLATDQAVNQRKRPDRVKGRAPSGSAAGA
jgi:hypothetical protein